MLNALFDQGGQLLQIAREGLRYESSSRCKGHLKWRQCRFDGAFRRTLCLEAFAASRGSLAFGQTINLIIHNDISDIDVPSNRMNGMTHSNCEAIAVSTGSDDGQITVRQLHALGNRQRTAMDAMQSVSIYISRNPAGTTDSGNDSQPLRLQSYIRRSALNGSLYGEVSASWTPVRFNFIAKLFKSCHLHQLLLRFIPGYIFAFVVNFRRKERITVIFKHIDNFIVITDVLLD
ncbi:hypothetical protein D3C77_468000 [compost metagenome]